MAGRRSACRERCRSCARRRQSCSLEDQDRWTIPSWTRFAVQTTPAATRRRRVVRQRPAEPPRVHPARDDHRALDGVDQRVIAACGGGATAERQRRSGPAAPAGRRLAQDRRHDPGRRPASRSRSTRSRCRTSAATASPPSRSSSCARRTPSAIRAASPRASPQTWTPNADGTVWTFKLRQGVEVAARRHRRSRRPTSWPPWSASSRPATPGSRASSTRAAPSRPTPNTVTFTLVGGNGNFPYLVSIYNAQTLITPADYVAGTTFDERPDRDRRLEARQLRPGERRDVRAQSRLVGRPDAARRHRVDLLRRHRPDDHRLPGRPGRRHRPVRRAHRRIAVRRPELHA